MSTRLNTHLGSAECQHRLDVRLRGTGRTTRMLVEAALTRGNVAIVGLTEEEGKNLVAVAKDYAKVFGNSEVALIAVPKDEKVALSYFDAVFIDHAVGDME